MCTRTYDALWREAMAELDEQVRIEDSSLDDEQKEEDGKEPPAQPPQANIVEAFQHFACLYIKYVQMMKKLERCYDAIVHPQKRMDVKVVLELVLRRLLELQHLLVKWNPPSPSLRPPPTLPEVPFPWDYVNLDDILVDLKLPPETLDIPIPRYIRQDYATEQVARDKLVAGYCLVKTNHMTPVPLEEERHVNSPTTDMTLDKAIEILQRNERGRQGKARGVLVRELRLDQKRNSGFAMGAVGGALAEEPLDTDLETAAGNIQRVWRGRMARAAALKDREEELIYIGMKPRPTEGDEYSRLEMSLSIALRKRRQEQAENAEAYTKALDDLRYVVLEEEGPEIREALREERTSWVANKIALDKFPEDLNDFYSEKSPPAEEPLQEAPKSSAKGGKGDKENKKEKKGGKKGKGGDGSAKSGPELPPPLQGRSALTEAMFHEVKRYQSIWEDRDESNNFAQRHDVGMVKDKIRPSVEEELRAQVDEILIQNLRKIKMQISKQDKKKGGKKGGKGKGKKGGKGKGKKGAKGKKGKGLPGDKISDLKGMEVGDMLSGLVEVNTVVSPQPYHIANFVGDFNYLGTIHQHAERRGAEWVPEPPSMAQIRQVVTQYCVLQNASPSLRAALPVEAQVRSVMYYGPKGGGKTMMAQAVAFELGALCLDLSPRRLQGLFPGKTGPTKLVHMAFAVARDISMGPVVIYIDECELVFAGGGKKAKGGDKDGPSRFKKDLLTYKNSLVPEDRVIIIGCTSNPDGADMKDLRAFFNKFVYFPLPTYASRLMLWKSAVADHVRAVKEGWDTTSRVDPAVANNALNQLNFGSLAHASECYSAGSICTAIKRTLTERRLQRLAKQPLDIGEFVGALASQPQLSAKATKIYEDFMMKIAGLPERKKLVQDLVASADSDRKNALADKKKKK